MKRTLLITAMIITMAMLLPTAVHAQTATVTGHIQFPSGGASTNARVCFTLQNFKPNIPRIVATGIIVQQQNWCVTPAADGSISASIDRNDLISPVGTFWRVDYMWNGVQQSSANYLINHTPFNLDTEVPLNQTVPAGPNEIVIACYPFLQSSPATTWTITHNENDANVFVQTNDLNGRAIFADTTDISNPNVTTITWIAAQSGRALVCHGGSINIATNQPDAFVKNPIIPQTVNAQPTTFQGLILASGGITASQPITLDGLIVAASTLTAPDATAGTPIVLNAGNPNATHNGASITLNASNGGTIHSGGNINLNPGTGAGGNGGIALNGDTSVSGELLVNTGIRPNSTGFSHVRGTSGCSTGASVGSKCSTTINWATTFVDTNYTILGCSGIGLGSGVPTLGEVTAKTTTFITIQTIAVTAASAGFVTIECGATHD